MLQLGLHITVNDIFKRWSSGLRGSRGSMTPIPSDGGHSRQEPLVPAHNHGDVASVVGRASYLFVN